MGTINKIKEGFANFQSFFVSDAGVSGAQGDSEQKRQLWKSVLTEQNGRGIDDDTHFYYNAALSEGGTHRMIAQREMSGLEAFSDKVVRALLTTFSPDDARCKAWKDTSKAFYESVEKIFGKNHIPESVKKALDDHAKSGGAMKPLTARRIKAVDAAVRAAIERLTAAQGRYVKFTESRKPMAVEELVDLYNAGLITEDNLKNALNGVTTDVSKDKRTLFFNSNGNECSSEDVKAILAALPGQGDGKSLAIPSALLKAKSKNKLGGFENWQAFYDAKVSAENVKQGGVVEAGPKPEQKERPSRQKLIMDHLKLNPVTNKETGKSDGMKTYGFILNQIKTKTEKDKSWESNVQGPVLEYDDETFSKDYLTLNKSGGQKVKTKDHRFQHVLLDEAAKKYFVQKMNGKESDYRNLRMKPVGGPAFMAPARYGIAKVLDDNDHSGANVSYTAYKLSLNEDEESFKVEQDVDNEIVEKDTGTVFSDAMDFADKNNVNHSDNIVVNPLMQKLGGEEDVLPVSRSMLKRLAIVENHPVVLFDMTEGSENISVFNQGFDGEKITGKPLCFMLNSDGTYESVTCDFAQLRKNVDGIYPVINELGGEESVLSEEELAQNNEREELQVGQKLAEETAKREQWVGTMTACTENLGRIQKDLEQIATLKSKLSEGGMEEVDQYQTDQFEEECEKLQSDLTEYELTEEELQEGDGKQLDAVRYRYQYHYNDLQGEQMEADVQSLEKLLGTIKALGEKVSTALTALNKKNEEHEAKIRQEEERKRIEQEEKEKVKVEADNKDPFLLTPITDRKGKNEVQVTKFGDILNYINKQVEDGDEEWGPNIYNPVVKEKMSTPEGNQMDLDHLFQYHLLDQAGREYFTHKESDLFVGGGYEGDDYDEVVGFDKAMGQNANNDDKVGFVVYKLNFDGEGGSLSAVEKGKTVTAKDEGAESLFADIKQSYKEYAGAKASGKNSGMGSNKTTFLTALSQKGEVLPVSRPMLARLAVVGKHPVVLFDMSKGKENITIYNQDLKGNKIEGKPLCFRLSENGTYEAVTCEFLKVGDEISAFAPVVEELGGKRVLTLEFAKEQALKKLQEQQEIEAKNKQDVENWKGLKEKFEKASGELEKTLVDYEDIRKKLNGTYGIAYDDNLGQVQGLLNEIKALRDEFQVVSDESGDEQFAANLQQHYKNEGTTVGDVVANMDGRIQQLEQTGASAKTWLKGIKTAEEDAKARRNEEIKAAEELKKKEELKDQVNYLKTNLSWDVLKEALKTEVKKYPDGFSIVADAALDKWLSENSASLEHEYTLWIRNLAVDKLEIGNGFTKNEVAAYKNEGKIPGFETYLEKAVGPYKKIYANRLKSKPALDDNDITAFEEKVYANSIAAVEKALNFTCAKEIDQEIVKKAVSQAVRRALENKDAATELYKATLPVKLTDGQELRVFTDYKGALSNMLSEDFTVNFVKKYMAGGVSSNTSLEYLSEATFKAAKKSLGDCLASAFTEQATLNGITLDEDGTALGTKGLAGKLTPNDKILNEIVNYFLGEQVKLVGSKAAPKNIKEMKEPDWKEIVKGWSEAKYGSSNPDWSKIYLPDTGKGSGDGNPVDKVSDQVSRYLLGKSIQGGEAKSDEQLFSDNVVNRERTLGSKGAAVFIDENTLKQSYLGLVEAIRRWCVKRVAIRAVLANAAKVGDKSGIKGQDPVQMVTGRLVTLSTYLGVLRSNLEQAYQTRIKDYGKQLLKGKKSGALVPTRRLTQSELDALQQRLRIHATNLYQQYFADSCKLFMEENYGDTEFLAEMNKAPIGKSDFVAKLLEMESESHKLERQPISVQQQTSGKKSKK